MYNNVYKCLILERTMGDSINLTREMLFPELKVLIDSIGRKGDRLRKDIWFSVTSLDRFQQLLNDDRLKEEWDIKNIYVGSDRTMSRNFNPHLASTSNTGRKPKFITNDLGIVAFADGGLEYLDSFTGTAGAATDSPSYSCKLWVPETKTILAYSHPVKDPALLERLKER